MSGASNIQATPFWQGAVAIPTLEQRALPKSVDVLIVGAGYTGLSAARETAAAGLDTWVLDAGAIGAGCSGRNGGQVAYSLKPSLEVLATRHGPERAFAICREGYDAVAYLRSLSTAGHLDCDWRESGCFYGAHTARHFARMAREATQQTPGLTQRIIVVPRSRQREEIATDFYQGGCVYLDDASVDPMKLLLGLLARAELAGATIRDHCTVTAIERSSDGFEVTTAWGRIRAGKVLLATNGYTGSVSSWHQRRVIPIGS
jgi:glycine/D-amino acid oxidase-like deaminating enzyme